MTVPTHGACSTVLPLRDALLLEPRACLDLLPKEGSRATWSAKHLSAGVSLALGLMTVAMSLLLSFSLEMKQLLQAKVGLEKELELIREGEKERQEREEDLR